MLFPLRKDRIPLRLRPLWLFLALALAVVLAFVLGSAVALFAQRPAAEPVRIGVLHALTGFMAESEGGLVDALQLAAAEINAQGGILGAPLELVIVDTASDWERAAQQAERLIREVGVKAMVACWTSSCRKAVLPVVERHQSLMFYPLQYEGLEESKHVLYLGAAPNQQILPGARWALEKFGKRLYLIGSDYVFPRTANQLIRDIVEAADGQIVAERYASVTANDFGPIAAEIRRLAPDAILNTVNGASNHALFAALRTEDLSAIPVISFSIAEPELKALGAEGFHPAHYAVWGYFQSLPGERNREFVAAFQQRYGAQRVTSDPIVAAYNSLHLWARAVHDEGSTDPFRVAHSLRRQSLAGPSGVVAIDPATRHLWRRVYVGHAQADGQFVAQEISDTPVRPAPFPPHRDREEWLRLIETLNAEPGTASEAPSEAPPEVAR